MGRLGAEGSFLAWEREVQRVASQTRVTKQSTAQLLSAAQKAPSHDKKHACRFRFCFCSASQMKK
eukprot:3635226-Ditylum_brightwellii.AAC.1